MTLARTVAVLVLALVLAAPARAEVRLERPLVQGGLVVGTTTPGARVSLDSRPMRVSAEGCFLLGFGRNAAARAKLEVISKDGRTETWPLAIARRDWQVQRIDGLPPRKVTPPPEDLERIAAERELIVAVRRGDSSEPFFEDGFAWPLVGTITGIFGSQRILNGQPRSPHAGVDIAAPTGTPVRAAAAGTVVLVHPGMLLTGKTVMIDHGHGLTSVYIHLDSITVSEGDRIDQGAIIGTVGATGRATGPHLHWGVSLFDVALDPELLVGPMPTAGQSGQRR